MSAISTGSVWHSISTVVVVRTDRLLAAEGALDAGFRWLPVNIIVCGGGRPKLTLNKNGTITRTTVRNKAIKDSRSKLTLQKGSCQEKKKCSQKLEMPSF